MRSRRLAPYLFVLPNVLVVLAFATYPLLANVALSLNRWSLGSSEFVGLANYVDLLEDEAFWISVRNTFYYTILVVPTTTVLSLLIAIGLNRAVPFKNAIRAAYLIPRLVSWAVAGLIWRWLYSPNYGIFNVWLDQLGLPIQRWLLDPELTIPSLALVGIWAGLGYYMVIYLAGLQGIPGVYYEAAQIDGATGWQQFRFITLPLLNPMTVLVMILSILASFRVFEHIYVMTGGGPGRASFVLVLYLYITGFTELKLGYASAVAIALFVIMFFLTLLQSRMLKASQ